MKKIGLIGFGKTGKAVANVVLQQENYSLEWVLRKSEKQEHISVKDFMGIECDDPGKIYALKNIHFDSFIEENPVDYIIDFSSEFGIYTYGDAAARKHIKIITAISHYDVKTVKYLKSISHETTVMWSPNITLGVNFLLTASRILKKIAPYVDIEIIEEHFKQKKGISGTALKIADKLRITNDKINSIRVGGIVGKHEVIFGFPYQTIRLVHESISREAFGNGVIFAADNLHDKSKGYYQFEDLLLPYFSIS